MQKITYLLTILTIFLSWSGHAQFPEGFETAVPPTGWTTYRGADDAGAANDWLQSDDDSNTGTYSAFVRYSSFVDAEDWLVTPEFTPDVSANFLEFYQRQSFGTDYGNAYDILVSTTSQTDRASFVVVDSQTEADVPFAFAPRYVDLSAYDGTPIYVAFRMSNNFGDNWYIDDVNLILPSSPPLCAVSPVPANAAVDVVTDGGDLTLTWDPAPTGDAPSSYEFSLGDDNTLGLFTTVVGTNSIDLINLVPGTEYFWSVTPINSGGPAAGPCETWSFTTENPPPPPANDECDDAIALTVNGDFSCGAVTSGTTVGATASAQADDVSGTPNTDVWFSFVATNDAHRVELQNVENQGGGTSTSTDMGMGVYDATGGCLGLVFVDTSDPNTLNLTGLSIGTTYLVRVYGWFSSIQYNTFDICVGTPSTPPANDDCANATVVSAPSTSAFDTSSATADGPTANCGTTPGGPNVWFVYTATGTGDLLVSTCNDADFDTKINVYSGDCSNLVCEGGNDDNSGAGCTGNTSELTLTGLAAGDYYIAVSGFSGATGTGNLTLDFTLSDGSSLEQPNSLSYYPNPVKNTLTLNAQNTIDNVVMYNMLGQEVLKAAPNAMDSDIDMSNLQNGTYFVKVFIGDSTKTIKVIKH